MRGMIRKGWSAMLAAAVAISLLAVSAQAGEVFVTSALAVDVAAGRVVLPLHEGFAPDGDSAWFVITEVSDREVAEKLGVNWSPKLVNALGTTAVQQVEMFDHQVFFAGVVDFSPQRMVVPDPVSGFPPLAAAPGGVGDARYSPLISGGDGIVYNAPQVANSSGLHDRVLEIDFDAMSVTLELTTGLYHGKRIYYVSFEASDPGVAAIEAASFAPTMDGAPGLASNAGASARSSIVPIVNGETGPGNRNRQGLQSALLGEGSPLNVTVIHPRNRGNPPGYSPLWDVHPAVWTETAIGRGQRMLLDHHAEVAKAVTAGQLVSGGMGPANADLGGLRAAGFIVNCPVMAME